MNVRVRTASQPDVVRTGGTVAERYRSLFVIGKGGMGSVEVALERGAGGFERIVALKRMLPEASRDTRQTSMFLREARLAALLAHPNVVHAFAFGESEGELFLAMEYVEGEPLSHVLRVAREREGGLSPELVAFVLAQVCDGLHAAHELCDVNGTALNVIHRDVSPHNVMIAYEGHIKLLDFGVAKIDSEKALTRTGEVKGKTAYMSPEQAMGDPLDRRSDLFSVGAVLFECITGRKMWGDGTDLDVLRKLALEPPPRLDVAAPRAPRALCDLHARLVARAPADRPGSARAVAAELRAWLASSGARIETSAAAATMERLFSAEAAQRRKALNDALREAAPEEVEVLRKSLTGATPARGKSAAAHAVAEGHRATRRGIVLSALGGLILAAVIVGTLGRGGDATERARPAAAPARATPSASANVIPSANANGLPSASANAAPSASAIPAASANAIPSATARATSGTRAAKRPPKPATSASGKVDVDPEPF
jgi:hypothetical protein